MASLLADIDLQTSGTAPAAFADVPGFSAMVTVASTASIIILQASLQVSTGSDSTIEFRWAVGGVREGPVGLTWDDGGSAEDNGLAGFSYALTGLSGSQTFSLQWRNTLGSAGGDLDTAVVRTFQVLEIA